MINAFIWKCRMVCKRIVTKYYQKHPERIEDEKLVSLIYFITFGKWPDLKTPKKFSEYICKAKMEDEKLNYCKYTDKYEVRKYVAMTIGEQYLNQLIGVYENVDEIPFDDLPEKFVLKCTHGSSFNIVVFNRQKFNAEQAKKTLRKWMSQNFYYKDREKNYKNICPRIMCDTYIETENGVLDEYKLFCFNGKVRLIQHNTETEKKRYANMYDEQWKALPVKYGYPPKANDKLPEEKKELIPVAEKLSAPFKFVRVDLYLVGDRVIFSELTFHSGGGYIPFVPEKYDLEFGKFFEEEKHVN